MWTPFPVFESYFSFPLCEVSLRPFVWEVEGIKHSCVVPVTVWISACVIWVAPCFPLVFPLSLNFTSGLIVMQIEKYVVGFVSIHFHDFWNLSVRKTHFTPSVWMISRWFVSFCHFYFRSQYLILLSWCMSWRRSNWVFLLMAIQWPQRRLCVSLWLLLTEAGLIHALAVLTPSLLWLNTNSPACLPVEHLRCGASTFHHATSAFLTSSNSLAVIRWVDTGCPEGLPVLMVQ